jgi:dehydrodolichyl diphosphate syntase complex subunit NUS1
MSLNLKDKTAYREDVQSGHRRLDNELREHMIKVRRNSCTTCGAGNLLESTYSSLPSLLPRLTRIRNQQTYVPESQSRKVQQSRFGIRGLVKKQIYTLLYVFIHAIFSVYIRFRIAYHAVSNRTLAILNYHHQSPDYVQRDVKSLKRLPNHLSVILSLEDGGRRGDAMEKLINEVSEVAAWCASAGIPNLSVYEKTGKPLRIESDITEVQR